MAHHRGPKTTTQDLIFYYDTGNEKSFAGEPTTNYIPSSFGYGLYAYVSGPVDTTVNNEYNRPITAKRYTITQAINTARAAIFPIGLTAGVSFTFSFKWKYNGTTTASPGISVSAAKGNPEGGANNNSFTSQTTNTVSIGNGWYLSTYTFVFSSVPTGKCILTFGINTGSTAGFVGETFDVYEAQFEIKDHKTPYVLGTRSVTQGLIDLTRNETINLSSVSFDSNAQMSFDGTDDFIDTNFSPTSINNPTIEAVVYRNTATGRYEAIIQNNLDSDDALYVYPSGVLGFWPCSPSSLTVPTGQWSYVAVSYNGTTLTYCVNGTIQVVTTTCADIMDWDFLRIGAAGSGDGERWIGKIAIAKVYNRALTSSELYQNYNAIKTRFGI
jgi:hypothetical protein